MATIPATVARPAPTGAWIAHVDTSPETSGHNARPIPHKDHDSLDLVLPGDPRQVTRDAERLAFRVLNGPAASEPV